MVKLNKPVKEYIESQYLWCKEGANCWVEQDAGDHLENEDVFIPSKLVSVDVGKKTAEVTYEQEFDGATTVHITRVMPRDPKTYPDLSDLVDLPLLNDAELHQKIKERFAQLKIFTYIGPSLLIMNPFKFIPSQYLDELKDTYYGCIMNPATARVRDHAPHVWAISTQSYLELFNNNKNQAICISGESGAGKTVNTKTAMAFLTGLNEKFGGVRVADGEAPIEDRILMCNPVLEALGNAKTVRNDNSSRFGKYISLFIENKCIVGASIKSYLLEAIRITTPNESERNYHIFYQLLKAGTDEMISKYKVDREPYYYPYLKKSGCKDVITIDDKEEYNELIKSFNTLGVDAEKQDAFWRIIAAVLHTSLVAYDDSSFDGSGPCAFKDLNPLKLIAHCLEVDLEMLKKALTTKTSVVMKEEVVIFLDKNACDNQCEAFAKEIYSKLFDWIIKYLNLALLPDKEKVSGANPELIYKKIGLLDIFGFEIFDFNSIEQLCINFTNEKLHQLYIEYVFKLEEVTFINEGLKAYLGNLNFEDNQEILDLLAHPDKKKFSVFNLIDDQSATMAKDMNLMDQFNKFHKDNKVMQFDRIKRNVFSIVHTAKPVGYTIDGFCEKNKDEVAKPIILCVLDSKNQGLVDIYIQKIFAHETGVDYFADPKSKKENFIGYKFRQQMDSLMTELRSCQCSFMRCIKPNEVKSATVWCPTMVVNQIRYLGLLDSIKIRKESYPFRFNFDKFVLRYLELEPEFCSYSFDQLKAANPDWVQLSKNICKNGIPSMGTDFLLYGNTRVFMKSEAYEELEAVYQEAVKLKKAAILAMDKLLLQIVLKNRIMDFRRKGMVTVDVCKQMLSGIAGKKGAGNFVAMRKHVIRMQKGWRAKRLFREARKMRMALQSVQAAVQAFVTQKKRQKVLVAAKKIWIGYEKWRKWNNYKKYVDIMWIVIGCANTAIDSIFLKEQAKAAIIVQKYWRGYAIRQEFSDVADRAKKAKQTFLENKANKTLKRYLKGRIARMKIKRIQKAACYIQAYFKMRWTKGYYHKMRRAAVTIQRALKDGLRRKLVRKARRREYLREEYIPFLKACYKDQSRLYEVDVGADEEIEDGLKLGKVKLKDQYEQTPEIDPAHISRARFFNEVIDVDYINDIRHVYLAGWGYNYVDAHKDVQRLKSDVRVIEAGSRHTIMATSQGRCYTWGENDEMQLGTDQTEETMAVFRVLKGEERLRRIASGNDHGVILTKHKTCFTFGKNDIGQLGLGDTKIHERIILNETLTRCKLSGVYAQGEESYGVTGDGKVLFWPTSPHNPSIGRLRLPHKQKAKMMAMGHNFVLILTQKGYVYSFGQDNSRGQLGLGHVNPVAKPTWISSIEKERVTSISCGRTHCLALTKNSKIYSWGSGTDGQLGVGSTDDFLNPTQVALDCISSRVTQVSASFRGSYALLDDGKVFWWGRNSRIRKLTKPQLFRGSANAYAYAVQIRSSWSENLSLSYIIFCDLRYLDGMKISSKKNISQIMAKKWAEGTSQFELPHSEGYSKYVTTKNLDFKKQKDPRKNPDPVRQFEVYERRPNMTDDFESSELIKLQTTSNSMSPTKQRTKKAPYITKNLTRNTENWKQTLATSPQKYDSSPIKGSGSANARGLDQFKSSARRNQYNLKNNTIEELKAYKKKDKNTTGLDPDAYYDIEELKGIKRNVKALMMKPRKNWTKADFTYLKLANTGDLKLRLSKIKY